MAQSVEEIRRLAVSSVKQIELQQQQNEARRLVEEENRKKSAISGARGDLPSWLDAIDRATQVPRLHVWICYMTQSTQAQTHNRTVAPLLGADSLIAEGPTYLSAYAEELERLLGPPFRVKSIDYDSTESGSGLGLIFSIQWN